jgi:hypothetical protein
MLMVIVIPDELKLSNTITCESISGLSTEAACTFNNGNLTLKNAFTSQTEPKLIKFWIENFTNPATTLRTKSFKFYTFTSDGYLIDSLDSNVLIDFKCALPCKTCLPTNNTGCSACFTDSKVYPSYLYRDYCISECPASFFVSS